MTLVGTALGPVRPTGFVGAGTRSLVTGVSECAGVEVGIEGRGVCASS